MQGDKTFGITVGDHFVYDAAGLRYFPQSRMVVLLLFEDQNKV